MDWNRLAPIQSGWVLCRLGLFLSRCLEPAWAHSESDSGMGARRLGAHVLALSFGTAVLGRWGRVPLGRRLSGVIYPRPCVS
jgi:hypothetical protein